METPEKKEPTKTITYDELDALLTLIKGKIDISKRSRLTFAVEKLAKKWATFLNKFEEKKQAVDFKYCLKDEDGALRFNEVTITDKNGNKRTENNGSCRFKPEDRKNRDAEIRKMYEEKVTIPVFLLEKQEPSVAHLLKNTKLSFSEINLLAGTLIDIPAIDFEKGEIDEWLLSDNYKSEKAASNGAEKEHASV